MAITPPWALHVGAANCFNRPTAIGMATPVTSDDTFVIFTALDGGCHFHHALRSGPIVPALKNASHTDEGSKNWRKHNEENAW
jgi:hypothetical protein